VGKKGMAHFLPSFSLRSPLGAEALAKAIGEGGQVQILLSNYACRAHKSNREHLSGVKVDRYKGHNIESRMFKNRDKQMTFIVRVRCFTIFYVLIISLFIISFIDTLGW